MAKFFVGQRVRLARPYFPEYADDTGRISSFIDASRKKLRNPADRTQEIVQAVDCRVVWDNGRETEQHTSQLEPETPSGAAPSEYTYTELMDRLKAGEVERV